MSIILVPSIHHTGTKLVFNNILQGLEEVNQQETWKTSGKIRIHVDTKFLQDLKFWREKAKIIVPIRHPEKLLIGWKVRHKPVWELKEQLENMQQEIMPYADFVLPIDVEYRDRLLQRIGKKLKMKLETQWPIIGSCNITTNLKEEDKRLVDKWIETYSFFAYYKRM